MTTWDGNSYYFGESGESVVAFQRHVGVVVVLADPIASPDRLAAAVDEFTTMSEANGLTPCLFSVGKETADAAARRGWRTVQVAEDTIVDLPDCSSPVNPGRTSARRSTRPRRTTSPSG